MRASDIIRTKRVGTSLSADDMQAFVDGIVSGSWGDAEVGAMAMAMVLNGLSLSETASLTRCMTHSGVQLQWDAYNLPGPLLDKHSTGGVGDKVSLLLAPIVAACGGFVPMISGRALGHTGGTLDKLESIPGYNSSPQRAHMQRTLQQVGCVIVGASADLAPADARFYAIRDLTATVESHALITASILSKKLAAGLQGLVMDIKAGSGAFCKDVTEAQQLGHSLLGVAQASGLPACAWVTDMNQVLGSTCGNALEVAEAIAYLRGDRQEARLDEVTRGLCADLLILGGLANDMAHAEQRVDAVLRSGAALEKFARMVHALGGPADLVDRPANYLPQAPQTYALLAPHTGWLSAVDTRAWGSAVRELASGFSNGNAADPSTGLSDICPLGTYVQGGQPLAQIHAANAIDAARASKALLASIQLGDAPPDASKALTLRLQSP